MKWLSSAIFAFLLTCTTVAFAKDSQGTSHYLDPATFDLKVLLPDPPADGSSETKKEIEIILEKQQTRTPDDVARAESEVKLTTVAFKEVLGPWFDPEKLPLTETLLKNAVRDAHDIADLGKKYWNRLRPPPQDQRVHAAVNVPVSASYPSGHSTEGTVLAIVLAELAPDLKGKLLDRGRQIGDDRVMAGVHFPSDVEAGRTLGREIAARLLADPAFQADLARAKVEFVQARSQN